MGDRFHSSMNKSPSKAQFAFSKSSRFPSPKQNTSAFGYEIPGYFGHKRGNGAGRPFNTSEKKLQSPRFNSSDRLCGPNQIDRSASYFGQTRRYSFGVSRDTMKKVYVDEILKSGRVNNEPGPSNYTLTPGFGQSKNNGSLYSFRPLNDPMVSHLSRAAKLPGPGSYQKSIDLAGNAQLNSKLQNQPSNAFSKANDRFRTTSEKNPAGANYNPRQNLNEHVKSEFRFPGATKFGKNTRTFIDQNWSPKEQKEMPSPGKYNSFSEFSGIQAKK